MAARAPKPAAPPPAGPAPTVLVMGAGLIGCWLGGRLQAAGATVHLVGRPRMLQPLAAQGLTLTDLDDGQLQLPAAQLQLHETVPAGLRPDLVLLCVKSGATAGAAAELAAALAKRKDVAAIELNSKLSMSHPYDDFRDSTKAVAAIERTKSQRDGLGLVGRHGVAIARPVGQLDAEALDPAARVRAEHQLGPAPRQLAQGGQHAAQQIGGQADLDFFDQV